MTGVAELELSLRRFDAASYTVDLRFSLPASDVDVRPDRRGPMIAQFDLPRLHALAADPDAYGALLTASLFAPAELATLFQAASAAALSQQLPLRVRLSIDVGAPELHSLRWELLRDPLGDAPLSMSEQIRFSRYLSSADWRQARVRRKGEIRALVFIAHPSDLATYQLATFDWAAEQKRLAAALGAIPTTFIAPGSATLAQLEAELRNAPDLVIIVAHGRFRDGPVLWLERPAGDSDLVPGAQLELLFRTVEQCPRLVILASCQSAGDEYDALLNALAPRLASAGVPAVIGMSGTISVETAGSFQRTLIAELLRDGEIDRAVAAARRAVRLRGDFWMPVLFSRLRSGRLWYVPGFGDDQQGFARWPSLRNSILNQRCTPILGSGLFEPLLGSTREIARQWAETHGFPMEPHEREDLPQVAQFLAVNQDSQFPRDELANYLRNELVRRFGDQLPPELREARPGTLDRMIESAGALLRKRAAGEPHDALARLPFPIYITTNADQLIEAALTARGKQPRALICPWNDYVRRTQDDYDDQPTPEHPLVYHLFGRLSEPDSVVLTEDDYFDFLINVTRNSLLIPDTVGAALNDTALLFLGFRLDDWSFRVLFRSLISKEGRLKRRRLTHVAVQIDPDEGQITNPDRARVYLEEYFQGADISIYWGSVEDFITELLRQLPDVPVAEQPTPAGAGRL